MASSSWREYTAPVGFDGELMTTSFVLGVTAASNCAAVTRNPVVSSARMYRGTAPASFTISG